MSNISHRIDSMDGNEGAAFISFLFSPDFLESEPFEASPTPRTEPTQSQMSDYSLTPQSEPSNLYRYDPRQDSVRSSFPQAGTSTSQYAAQSQSQIQSQPQAPAHHLQQVFHRSSAVAHSRDGETTEEEDDHGQPQGRRVRARVSDDHVDSAHAHLRARYTRDDTGVGGRAHLSAGHTDRSASMHSTIGGSHPREFDNGDY